MKSQYADLYATYVAAKGSEIMTAENSVASLSYTERTVNTDAAKLQTAIETKRQLYSTHYTAQNTAVLNKYFSDEDILFVSSYTPMAIVSVTAKELKALTSDSSVTHISLFENQELTLPIAIDTDSENRSATYIEEHWNKNSRADYVRDTLGLTGAGVKIGQVELGLPNVTDDLLTGATIITNSAFGGESWESHTYHATKVARIMVGTHGIVPDATLYSACAGESDQFYSAINWLISQGVNVINMSTCLAGTDVYGNQYDEFCNYVDALSLLYDVHFVASAGNYSDGQSAGLAPTYTLWRPALAYNAITVGAYNDNGTVPTNDTEILAKQGDDYLESYSKYNELDIADDAEDEVNVLNPYGAYKPNLVATGNYFWNESIANGTSYAAPQVTGVIAQLCSYDSTLKTKQSSMGAILMASCGRKLAAEVQFWNRNYFFRFL